MRGNSIINLKKAYNHSRQEEADAGKTVNLTGTAEASEKSVNAVNLIAQGFKKLHEDQEAKETIEDTTESTEKTAEELAKEVTAEVNKDTTKGDVE